VALAMRAGAILPLLRVAEVAGLEARVEAGGEVIVRAPDQVAKVEV